MTTIIPFNYDPSTGIFKSKKTGRVIGAKSNGYLMLWYRKHLVGAHRVAWFCVYGKWPKQIDHINGDPSDNRISNLRVATQSQNKQNARPKKTVKLKGTCYCRTHKKWRADIGPRGKVKHLGYFITQELAHAAYAKAAIELHGEYARTT